MLVLENMVCDETIPSYWRMFAWYRLLRIWSACRANDALHWEAARMRMRKTFFEIAIGQTKTSGPDKRMKALEAVVSKKASFSGMHWLEIGFAISQSSGFSTPRSFILCCANWTEDAFIDKQALYEDIARLSRQL